MNDFRGPLPLKERDFAEVRRSVLAKIERRSFAFPITLAAAAVLAVIIILLPQPRIIIPPPHQAPVQKAVVPRVAQTLVSVPSPARVSEPQKPTRPQKRSGGAPPPDTQITMNIETADPNVRIIWISR